MFYSLSGRVMQKKYEKVKGRQLAIRAHTGI